MKKIIKKGAKIERFTKSREDAIAYFQEKNEPYKVELIEDLPEGSEISFYSQGDWTDLCAGPHLMSVKGVKAFKLSPPPAPTGEAVKRTQCSHVSTEQPMLQRMS